MLVLTLTLPLMVMCSWPNYLISPSLQSRFPKLNNGDNDTYLKVAGKITLNEM